MTWFGEYVPVKLLAIVALLALGVAITVVRIAVSGLASMFHRRGNRDARTAFRPVPGNKAKPLQMPCTVCNRPLVFSAAMIEELTPTETALAVRARPIVLGRKLGEYVCPYCEAAHCFIVDGKQLQWVGANLYQPQARAARCQECRKLLLKPFGPPAGVDERVTGKEPLSPDLGLQCPHCGSVCCVACCERSTRNRTKDGTMLCPRCQRKPMDRIYRW